MQISDFLYFFTSLEFVLRFFLGTLLHYCLKVTYFLDIPDIHYFEELPKKEKLQKRGIYITTDV